MLRQRRHLASSPYCALEERLLWAICVPADRLFRRHLRFGGWRACLLLSRSPFRGQHHCNGRFQEHRKARLRTMADKYEPNSTISRRFLGLKQRLLVAEYNIGFDCVLSTQSVIHCCEPGGRDPVSFMACGLEVV
jgi:hypothetical protein